MIQRRARQTEAVSDAPVVVSAFYKFVGLDDPTLVRAQILEHCERLTMRGSVLVAPEGINGTIAGSRTNTDAFFGWLRSDNRFGDLEVKESLAPDMPFLRMKVRLKKEIVTFRQPVDPTVGAGTYVAPQEWNDVISDPDVLVIDTRNQEEVALGSFVNAVDPGTESFTEFADFVATLDPKEHRRVAMFCTGGIRCEKASAYMLDQGFDDVMHLQGGILKYLEDVEPDASLWDGECFVFDERVTVDHQLEPGNYTLCRSCRRALSEQDRADPAFEDGVSCIACIDHLTPARAERLRERRKQVELAEARGTQHLARKI